MPDNKEENNLRLRIKKRNFPKQTFSLVIRAREWFINIKWIAMKITAVNEGGWNSNHVKDLETPPAKLWPIIITTHSSYHWTNRKKICRINITHDKIRY